MNELKVGLLAIATMAAIVYMSLLVTSNQSGFGEYVPYRTIVRDASGIFPKTPIKVAGINAGRIKNIELWENNALITFEVLKKVKITEGSTLRIKTVGFLGDKYLEILVGDSDVRLEAMAIIKSEEGGGIENLAKDAAEVMKDVKVIVQSLKDSLAPKDQPSPIKKITQDLEATMANAKEATKSLKDLLKNNEKKLNNLIANMEKFSKDIAYQVNKDNQDSAMADIKKILANADKMMADLKQMVADVKAGKGTVGKLLVEEEIADEVQETLAGVKKLVGKVDAIRTELSLYTGANSSYGAETSGALKIFPSPERFYLLGITTSEFGPESEKVTTTIINGNETVEVRREKEKDEFRFSIQIGRRLQDWTFRGGLIESSGGLGVDYDVSHWGLRLTLDIFDYRDEVGVNVRPTITQQLWNVFYARMALEDALFSKLDPSLTLSAGLRFDDEDLKGLFGFFL